MTATKMDEKKVISLILCDNAHRLNIKWSSNTIQRGSTDGVFTRPRITYSCKCVDEKRFIDGKKSGGEGSTMKRQQIPLVGTIWKNIIRCAVDNVEETVTNRNNNTTGYIH